MKPSTILRKARALLTKGRWCQNATALDAKGKDVEPDAPDAVSRCMIGAIRAACPDRDDRGAAYAPLRYALATIDKTYGAFPSISSWNDAPGRTYQEVKAAYDAAIEIARKEGN